MDIRERVVRALRDAGVDAYTPGQRQGICNAPYVVVQRFGDYTYAATPQITGYTLLHVIGYVPLAQPQKMEPLLQQVDDALAGCPYLTPTNNREPESINDPYKAHEEGLEYQVQWAKIR